MVFFHWFSWMAYHVSVSIFFRVFAAVTHSWPIRLSLVMFAGGCVVGGSGSLCLIRHLWWRPMFSCLSSFYTRRKGLRAILRLWDGIYKLSYRQSVILGYQGTNCDPARALSLPMLLMLKVSIVNKYYCFRFNLLRLWGINPWEQNLNSFIFSQYVAIYNDQSNAELARSMNF